MIAYAKIDLFSPRAAVWREVFKAAELPLLSDRPVRGIAPGLDGHRYFYFLDLGRLDAETLARLGAHLAALCQISPDDPRFAGWEGRGVPILAEEVSVSYRSEYYL